MKLKKLIPKKLKEGQVGEYIRPFNFKRSNLKKGMQVKIESKENFLKNHYYDNFPEKYKKIAEQICGTVQTIESVGTYEGKNTFYNNIKLEGLDLQITEDDIFKIINKVIK